MSIDGLAKFLSALNNAVISEKGEKLVVSQIKGNCYAPVLTTNSITQYEHIKSLHAEIAKNNYSGLNNNEKAYHRALMNIMKNSLVLNVYDEGKTFYKTIEQLEEPISFPYLL